MNIWALCGLLCVVILAVIGIRTMWRRYVRGLRPSVTTNRAVGGDIVREEPPIISRHGSAQPTMLFQTYNGNGKHSATWGKNPNSIE